MNKFEFASEHINLCIDNVYYPGLQDACRQVLQLPGFDAAYGSLGSHHAYPGGLLVHTAEVLSYALAMAEGINNSVADEYQYIDSDVITVAAVFHDCMKIKDYTETGQKTQYRKLVRHLSGSHAYFLMCIEGKELPSDMTENIENCILAHHGRQEWGSPVEPQTPEAYILHTADMLSVNFGPNAKI